MRPSLHPHLEPSTFEAWYWLKVELQTYCQSQNLSVSGSKADLMQRISAHLSGLPQSNRTAVKAKKTLLPSVLTADTVIQPGWSLSTELRAFFVAQFGHSFRFNQALRDLFKNPKGETMADAVALYAKTRGQKGAIGTQFQFNQHIRDFYKHNPGATHAQALQSWRGKRATDGCLSFIKPQK